MSGFLGSGNWLFNRLDASGLPTGYKDMGNTTKFAINEPSKATERTSRQKATYGQALDDVYVKSSSALSIITDEIQPATLAVGLLGASSAQTQASGSASSQVVNITALDTWVDLGKSAIDPATFVAKPPTGTTPPAYVLGSDYLVNYDLGMVMALSTGTIVVGTIKCDFEYDEINSTIISGGVAPSVRGSAILDGKNLATGKSCIARIPLMVIAPTKELDFLSTSYMQIELGGTALLTDGASAPYTVELR